LAEFGAPCELPHSVGWILKRPIPGFPYFDAIGCYPLFSCRNWRRLYRDLHELEGDLVSIAMVADPFGSYERDGLLDCFPDRLIAYKDHYVLDIERFSRDRLPLNHIRNLRRAERHLDVELCEPPENHLDDWVSLYANLVERRGIRGIQAFSREAFRRQLQVPGMVALRASLGAKPVGMTLWYLQGDVAYYHLGAWDDTGYRLGASFVLFAGAVEALEPRARWLDLGGGAGAAANHSDGLTRFKRGWATGVRTAYFCGRILNRERYAEVAQAAGSRRTDYFPVYRGGEFP
jgi:hypothetical protein